MANDATKNPMILDTAGLITKNKIKVKGVLVFNTTADHAATLTDNDDNAVFQTASTLALYPFSYFFLGDCGITFDGIKISSLASGTKILIYTV